MIIKKKQARKQAILSLPLALLSCLTHFFQAYKALHGRPREKFAIARLPSSCGQQRWIFFSLQCFLVVELGSEVFFDLILRTEGRCVTWKCKGFCLFVCLFAFPVFWDSLENPPLIKWENLGFAIPPPPLDPRLRNSVLEG